MRLIDADALIPMMKYATTDNEIGVFPIKIGFNAIVKVINDSPIIEPERKTGRWIKDRRASLNGGSYEVFECSECKSAFNWRMRYCGHCGALMGGGESDG